jgi:hypothetical protein
VEPFFEGFNPRIRNVGTLLFTSTLLNARFINQFSYEQWMRVTNEFVAAITNSVLETALRQLPKSSYDLRHDGLLAILKARRNDLPRAMSAYYRFLNKSAFIQTSDKNELVLIKDAPDQGMQITIHKISRKGEIRQQLFSRIYYPDVTKEVRLFVGKGADSVVINAPASPIRLTVSGSGDKKYEVIAANKRVHYLNDTSVVPGNLFNVLAPLVTGGYNIDDGIIFGLGFRYTRGLDYTKPAFSTSRYTSFQQLTVGHSFSTKAFNVKYHAEWIGLIGKADLTLRANAFAPNNTQNFFGTGNESSFIKEGDYKKYYRARFSLYTLDPALRWGNRKGTHLSIGPSIQYYRYDSSDNTGRSIENAGLIHTYDSATVDKPKWHGGFTLDFVSDSRNSKLLPAWGTYVNLRMQGLAGLNRYSKSYGQLSAEAALYKSVDAKSNFVVAERVGAAAIVGNPAFYQTLFLGGQGNLLGYRQYRFAGQYMVYNNLEARIKLADFASYILPGQLGLIGLFDIGRVWVKDDHSNQWHNGVGGGLYFAPAQMLVFQVILMHSPEGLYPYFMFGMRF